MCMEASPSPAKVGTNERGRIPLLTDFTTNKVLIELTMKFETVETSPSSSVNPNLLHKVDYGVDYES